MKPRTGSAKGRAWHSTTCPLHEIAEHDCAYDMMACNCGFDPGSRAANQARRELQAVETRGRGEQS